MTTPLWTIMVVLVACVIGASGGLFFKMGSAKLSFNLKSIIYNKKLLIGVIAYGISTIMFIPALKYGELSVLYPFAATAYIWVALFSKWFLKEEINSWKWIGIAIILIGVSFIGLGS